MLQTAEGTAAEGWRCAERHCSELCKCAPCVESTGAQDLLQQPFVTLQISAVIRRRREQQQQQCQDSGTISLPAPAAAAYWRSVSNRVCRPYTDSCAPASATGAGPSSGINAETRGRIAQIRDVLPGYGDGFLAAALQVTCDKLGLKHHIVMLVRIDTCSCEGSFLAAALQVTNRDLHLVCPSCWPDVSPSHGHS